jgi:hypothetical protein
MTSIDVAFRYRVPPGEREMSALDRVHEVYGVRKISLDEAERIIKVEFDISRLTEDVSRLCYAEQVWTFKRK